MAFVASMDFMHRTITFPKLRGMWKRARTRSFVKSFSFHVISFSFQGAGSKRGQQPVSGDEGSVVVVYLLSCFATQWNDERNRGNRGVRGFVSFLCFLLLFYFFCFLSYSTPKIFFTTMLTPKLRAATPRLIVAILKKRRLNAMPFATDV